MECDELVSGDIESLKALDATYRLEKESGVHLSDHTGEHVRGQVQFLKAFEVLQVLRQDN